MALLKNKSERTAINILIDDNFDNIEQRYSEPAKLTYGNEKKSSECMRCANMYCIKYSDEEICLNEFKNFSFDRNKNVCPVDAIFWDYETEYPKINQNECIKCGLCATRCPLGAIYCSEGLMHISKTNNISSCSHFDEQSIKKQNAQINKIKSLGLKHYFLKENEEILSEIYNSIDYQINYNRFIRNIFIGLGYKCASCRQGNVHSRIDAIYSKQINEQESKGVIEIEFGADSLEAARAILDDIAVLYSTENLSKNENLPIVICLSLPNKRQGYYQVVKDIKNILDIRIQTISLGSLLILLWNSQTNCIDTNLFYLDFNDTNITRSILRKSLNRELNISKTFLGVFEPKK